MVNKYDVITFGSATWDIYLTPKEMSLIPSSDFISGEAIAFNLGSKIGLKKTSFNIGGGGVNSAHTFKGQGLKVAYFGSVGDDILGSEIINKLKKLKIETKLIQVVKASTNCSVIFNLKGKDRTVMVYRGASEGFKVEKLSKAKWFYLAPLSGKSALKTQTIIDFAFRNKIKVAFNPGNSQLSLPSKNLKNILDKVDVLMLNQEEASILTKNKYQDEDKIIKDLIKLYKGTIVMTKGDRGVTVVYKEKIYIEKSKVIKAIDKTGAGDAFNSAFISSLIKNDDVLKAINLGFKNASSCIKKEGSTNGLL